MGGRGGDALAALADGVAHMRSASPASSRQSLQGVEELDAATARPPTPPVASCFPDNELRSHGRVGTLANPAALLQLDGTPPRVRKKLSRPGRTSRGVTDFATLLDDAPSPLDDDDGDAVEMSLVDAACGVVEATRAADEGPRSPSPAGGLDDDEGDDDDDDGPAAARGAAALGDGDPVGASKRSRVMLLAVSESLKRRYDFESWRLATEPFVPRASLGGVPEFGDEYRAVCVDDGRLAEERFRATYGPSLRAFYDRGGVVVVLSSSAALAVPRDCLSPIFGCAWSYAAGSPRDDYVPTRAGARRLGLDGAATLACAKATLLAVGAGEALLVPRRLTANELGMTAAEYAAYDPPAGDHPRANRPPVRDVPTKLSRSHRSRFG